MHALLLASPFDCSTERIVEMRIETYPGQARTMMTYQRVSLSFTSEQGVVCRFP